MPEIRTPVYIQNAVDFAHALTAGDEGFAIVAKADLTGFELSDVSDAVTLGGHLPAYFLPAADFNPAAFEAAGAVTAGIAAHVNLADPHTQYALESALGTMATQAEAGYALLAGRVGGQTLIGGTASGNDLTLQSTSHATKGKIRFGSSHYDEVNNRLGIGTIPTRNLHVYRGTNESVEIMLQNDGTGTAVRTILSMWTDAARCNFYTFGSAYTSSGVFVPNRTVLDATGAAGFFIAASNAAGYISFATGALGSANERVKIQADGLVRFGLSGGVAATALVDLAASTTAAASLRARIGVRPTSPNAGDFWDDGATVAYQISAATNAIVNSLKLERGSSGTPAAGFGLGILAQLESSTTETQDAGRLTWAWQTATHASRASKGQLTSFYTSTERAAITWGADAAGPLLGFGAVTTPIAIPVLPTGAAHTTEDIIAHLQSLGLARQS